MDEISIQMEKEELVAYTYDTVHKYYSLLGGNGLLQHGSFFIALKAKAVLALFLQEARRSTVTGNNSCWADVTFDVLICTLFPITRLLEDDVNVSSNELGYLFSLCGLD